MQDKSEIRESSGNSNWTEEEDEKLRILIILKREKNWERISRELKGRSPSQCKHRWKSALSPSMVKVTERRKWVPEEDVVLSGLVNKYGTKNWRIIASHLRGRLPKQCRERWINHLDPSIVKGRLTEKEWNIVLDSHEELGNRWSEIAKLIPGRTPNQIKNHWHAMLRKSNKRKRRECSSVESSASNGSPPYIPIEPGTSPQNFCDIETNSPMNIEYPPVVEPYPLSQEKPSSPIQLSSSSDISDEDIEFQPKRKKIKLSAESKLDALVQIAEFMYQFELRSFAIPPILEKPSNVTILPSIVALCQTQNQNSQFQQMRINPKVNYDNRSNSDINLIINPGKELKNGYTNSINSLHSQIKNQHDLQSNITKGVSRFNSTCDLNNKRQSIFNGSKKSSFKRTSTGKYNTGPAYMDIVSRIEKSDFITNNIGTRNDNQNSIYSTKSYFS